MVFLGGTGFSSFLFNMPVNSFSTDYGESYGESSTVFQSQITGQFTDPTQFATPGLVSA